MSCLPQFGTILTLKELREMLGPNEWGMERHFTVVVGKESEAIPGVTFIRARVVEFTVDSNREVDELGEAGA